jgi:hypothetical protein
MSVRLHETFLFPMVRFVITGFLENMPIELGFIPLTDHEGY